MILDLCELLSLWQIRTRSYARQSRRRVPRKLSLEPGAGHELTPCVTQLTSSSGEHQSGVSHCHSSSTKTVCAWLAPNTLKGCVHVSVCHVMRLIKQLVQWHWFRYLNSTLSPGSDQWHWYKLLNVMLRLSPVGLNESFKYSQHRFRVGQHKIKTWAHVVDSCKIL